MPTNSALLQKTYAQGSHGSSLGLLPANGQWNRKKLTITAALARYGIVHGSCRMDLLVTSLYHSRIAIDSSASLIGFIVAGNI
jgi:hypothetical protein